MAQTLYRSNLTNTSQMWNAREDQNQVDYLTETPALFFDGLPSAVAADTTHPEGDAPSAHSHSPQGPGQPQSPGDHHPQHRGHRKDTQTVSSGPYDSGLFPTTAGSLSWQNWEQRQEGRASDSERFRVSTRTLVRRVLQSRRIIQMLGCDNLCIMFLDIYIIDQPMLWSRFWSNPITIYQSHFILFL